MSAAPSMMLDPTSQRGSPRRPLFVPLDVIVLRSGIPENLPGRCTDLSEGGVGAVVAGDLISGQPVAIELRLPNLGMPFRARALVRYQQRLRCGLQFVGLSPDEQDMIRYWASRAAIAPPPQPAEQSPAIDAAAGVETKVRRIRVRLRRFYAALAIVVAMAALAWWQWERSWMELEARAASAPNDTTPLRVPADVMQTRIMSKADPVYPETARRAGLQGVVTLDAVIATDGAVKVMTPVSGPEVLTQSAMAAVQSWKFAPYAVAGKLREVETTIAVQFKLH